jgi:hypothetical protein
MTDGSEQVPRARAADCFEADGGGLAIIDALSEGWGVEPLPRSKRVWVRHRRGHPARAVVLWR